MSVNYSELSDAELKLKYVILSKEVAKYNNFQMAKKILMNSLYGAAGNQGFRFYDPRMAEGITLTGQYFIRAVGAAIDAYISKIAKTPLKATFYQDTDSVVSSSLIYVNGEKITIGDFYDSICVDPIITTNGGQVKPVMNKTSYGVSRKCGVVESDINYVMKHTVKKRMMTIKVVGESVTVTEDHSIMVVRDNTLCEVTPLEIRRGDKILTIKE